jgi:hypothetical protein
MKAYYKIWLIGTLLVGGSVSLSVSSYAVDAVSPLSPRSTSGDQIERNSVMTEAVGPVSYAASGRADFGHRLAPLSDEELSSERGGFLTANGVDLDFCANVQTLVNGQLALQTVVQWSSSGATVRQTSGTGANLVTIPSSQLTGLFGSNSAGVAVSGVQITSPSGSIEVAANVAGGQLQNLVANSASNQSISQNTAITLAVYNFANWQQQLSQHMVSNQLANDILAASRFGH